MNQRIQELDKQAKIWAMENATFPISSHIPSGYITKFAELLIRECVKEIEFQYGGGSDQPMDNEWDRAIECVSSMVKYRFGVEE